MGVVTVTPPSDLPETSASPTWVSAAVTGMFHTLSVNHYTTTLDSSGLRRSPNRTPLCSNGSFPPRPTSHSDMLNCAAPAASRTISLHGRTIRNNLTELVFISIHGTLPAQRNHTITYTPEYTYISQLRITPLYPANTKHVCLLQERTPNSSTAHVTTGGRNQ